MQATFFGKDSTDSTDLVFETDSINTNYNGSHDEPQTLFNLNQLQEVTMYNSGDTQYETQRKSPKSRSEYVHLPGTTTNTYQDASRYVELPESTRIVSKSVQEIASAPNQPNIPLLAVITDILRNKTNKDSTMEDPMQFVAQVADSVSFIPDLDAYAYSLATQHTDQTSSALQAIRTTAHSGGGGNDSNGSHKSQGPYGSGPSSLSANPASITSVSVGGAKGVLFPYSKKTYARTRQTTRNQPRVYSHPNMEFRPVLYQNHVGELCCGNLDQSQTVQESVRVIPTFGQKPLMVPQDRVVKILSESIPEAPPGYLIRRQVSGRGRSFEHRHFIHSGITNEFGLVAARPTSKNAVHMDRESIKNKMVQDLRGMGTSFTEAEVSVLTQTRLQGDLNEMKQSMRYEHSGKQLTPCDEYYISPFALNARDGHEDLHGHWTFLLSVKSGLKTGLIVHRLVARGWVAVSYTQNNYPHEFKRIKVQDVQWCKDDEVVYQLTNALKQEIRKYRSDPGSYMDNIKFFEDPEDDVDGDEQRGVVEKNKVYELNQIPLMLSSDPPGTSSIFKSEGERKRKSNHWMYYASRITIGMLSNCAKAQGFSCMNNFSVVNQVREKASTFYEPLASYVSAYLMIYEKNMDRDLTEEFEHPSYSLPEQILSFNKSSKIEERKMLSLMGVQYWDEIHSDPATLPFRDEFNVPFSVEFHRCILRQARLFFLRYSITSMFAREYRFHKDSDQTRRNIVAQFVAHPSWGATVNKDVEKALQKRMEETPSGKKSKTEKKNTEDTRKRERSNVSKTKSIDQEDNPKNFYPDLNPTKKYRSNSMRSDGSASLFW